MEAVVAPSGADALRMCPHPWWVHAKVCVPWAGQLWRCSYHRTLSWWAPCEVSMEITADEACTPLPGVPDVACQNVNTGAEGHPLLVR
jgi:hypothetical protein